MLKTKILSKRELQIINFLCRGYKSKDISTELFISIKTVGHHRDRIRKKLKLSSTSEVVAFAVINNLHI